MGNNLSFQGGLYVMSEKDIKTVASLLVYEI